MEEKIMPQYAEQYDEEKLIHEYEEVRQSGECNMFNYLCVRDAAIEMELDELGSFIANTGRKGYSALLSNYTTLCKKYKIERDRCLKIATADGNFDLATKIMQEDPK